MPDNNYYEDYSDDDSGAPTGRISVLQLASGDVSLMVEEWFPNDVTSESEIGEFIFVFSPEKWTKFAEWAKGTVS